MAIFAVEAKVEGLSEEALDRIWDNFVAKISAEGGEVAGGWAHDPEAEDEELDAALDEEEEDADSGIGNDEEFLLDDSD